ncbi:enolase-phosphatase E1 [Tricladium varicosporioides]|nr:enolase-phosphatase E1 [Hymenoscyphus varicosporioides]
MENLDDIKIVVLDIEGTVCPISFVKDVLFPYALDALPKTLAVQWDDPAFTPYQDAFPEEYRASPDVLLAYVKDLMAQDLKIPYLKSLQGYLWKQGYASGSLKCPLFPDVAPALHSWRSAGRTIIIYSSGSVPAQKLLFQYTNTVPEADLRPLITDYFDTVNAGMKQEKESYEKIAATRSESISQFLFLSDNVKEVQAAKAAGMQSFIVDREGNAPLSLEDKEGQIVVDSFEGIKFKALGN